jgi:predicted nucleic acid-binding protein
LPDWAIIKKAVQLPELNPDPGETEAIALAKELDAFAVPLDDGEAR